MRKNSKATGAKKVTRAAKGPGFNLSGGSIPTLWPVTRLSNRQRRRQPGPSAVLVEGERVPAGKSICRKSVFISRVKSRTWLTPAALNA